MNDHTLVHRNDFFKESLIDKICKNNTTLNQMSQYATTSLMISIKNFFWARGIEVVERRSSSERDSKEIFFSISRKLVEKNKWRYDLNINSIMEDFF